MSGSGAPSLARLLDAENAERHRLSAALHDDPVQLLTVAVMRLDLFAGALDDERNVAMAEEVRGVVRAALESTRALCAELDAPVVQRDGLTAAIAELGEQLFSDASTHFTIEADVAREPVIEIASIVYRATREALSNVSRHANASEVRVALDDNDAGMTSVVRDDGSGFTPSDDDPREHGGVALGLALAADLVISVGGRWSIESAPGSGAIVTFWVPASL